MSGFLDEADAAGTWEVCEEEHAAAVAAAV